MPVLAGTVTGALYTYAAVRLRLARFYALALVALVAGAAVALLDASDAVRMTLFFNGLGLAQLIAGFAALLRYLRRNPLPEEAP